MSPEYAREWVQKAQADRTAAKRALGDCRRHGDQTEIACFHAQQCAEKYLKAILAKEGQYVPRVHGLLALGRLVKRFNFPSFRLERDFKRLEQYAVEVRYPGSWATKAEAKRAVGAMERIVIAALRILKKGARKI